MPESDAVIKSHANFDNLYEFRERLMNSREFKYLMLNIIKNNELDIIANKFEQSKTQDTEKLDFKINQTCDHVKNDTILNASRTSLLEYAKRHDVQYDSIVGIKKGCHPWHAIFNRIYLLSELVEQGYKGWVLYMDADAYIVDLNFSFKDYLSDKAEFAMIAARASETPNYWDINDGVFFANLSHPVCINIIKRWKQIYDGNYTDDDYVKADKWDMILNDQTTLHRILKYKGYSRFLLTEGIRELFNSRNARVIRQMLRPSATDNCEDSISIRAENITIEVNKVLAV